MTNYLSRAEVRSVVGRYAKIHTRDQGFAEDAAGAARSMTGLPEPFTRASSAHVGYVLLATAALALKANQLLPEKAVVDDALCQAMADKLGPMLLDQPPDAMRRVLRALAGAARHLVNPLDPKTNHQWGLWQFGHEGQPLTRESAQRLGIVRRFEGLSGDFTRLLHEAFADAVGSGPALAGWRERLPLLICHLDVPLHADLLRHFLPAAGGGLIVVSPVVPSAVRSRFWRESSLIAEDRAGRLTALFAPRGNAVLIERRAEGWTVSLPVGALDQRALVDRSLPAHWRVFARCTEKPAGKGEDAP